MALPKVFRIIPQLKISLVVYCFKVSLCNFDSLLENLFCVHCRLLLLWLLCARGDPVNFLTYVLCKDNVVADIRFIDTRRKVGMLLQLGNKGGNELGQISGIALRNLKLPLLAEFLCNSRQIFSNLCAKLLERHGMAGLGRVPILSAAEGLAALFWGVQQFCLVVFNIAICGTAPHVRCHTQRIELAELRATTPNIF